MAPGRALFVAVAVSCLVGVATPCAAQYTPPPCIAGSEIFADVPASDPSCPWIQALYRDAITTGCATSPLRYCPTAAPTRAGMAIFLERVLKTDKTWGEGRANVVRVGIPFLQGHILCSGVGTIKYGLSNILVPWGDAAAACPTGTWVCRASDIPVDDVCNTDLDLDCDLLTCNQGCLMNEAYQKGWLADHDTAPLDGWAHGENGQNSLFPICWSLPVWCCSQ